MTTVLDISALDISVPLVGWVFTAVGLVLVVAAPRWIHLAAVFSVPFSATAVLNFGERDAAFGSSAFGIQAWIFLGSLWLARELYDSLRSRSLPPLAPLGVAPLLLGAFVATASISLVMLVVIDGGFLALTPQANPSFEPLTFSSRNITQLLYLVFGSVFAVVTASRCLDGARRHDVVRAFVAGCAAVAIWGYVQLTLGYIGYEYPHALFNTNIQPESRGYEQFVEVGGMSIPRISSAAVEPSIFAQTLVTVVPLLALALLRRRPIFSRALDAFVLAATILILLLSTATTAYVGLLFLSLLGFAILDNRLRIVYGAAIVLALAVTSALYMTVSPVRGVLESSVMTKLDTWSVASRLSTVEAGWWHFVEYPVLGTGWASAPTQDLIVFVLANTGVVGFVVFAAFFLVTGRRLSSKASPGSVQCFDRALATGARGALIAVLVINLLTGFAFVFGHMWLIVALALTCGAVLARPIELQEPTAVPASTTVQESPATAIASTAVPRGGAR